MTKNISIDEVKKLAELSQISISDDEANKLAVQMDGILDYVKQLEEVDTSDTKPTSQVTGLKNSNRPDEEIDYSTKPQDLLDTTPDVSKNMIKTKRIL